jgi:hypothetical protein
MDNGEHYQTNPSPSTPITDLMRILLAAGCSVEQALTAAQEIEINTALQKRHRLAKNAARQQRWRVKSKNQDPSVDVTERYVTPTNAYHPPPSMVSPNTPSLTPSPLNSKPKKVSRCMPIPQNWLPNRDFARQLGWSEDKIDAEEARFRDWALSKAVTYRDWDAAWRNWVRSPFQTPPKPQGSNGKRAGSLLDAIDRLTDGQSGLDSPAIPHPLRRISAG